MTKRRALISVYDKTGVVPFAQALVALGYEIVSTGGTYALLTASGVPVLAVSDVTQFPEMMDGRLKTLHPMIHGALLAVRDDAAHVAAMDAHGIVPIDVVAVNLYPFVETANKRSTTIDEAIEQIDIGGPTMLRAAAKNHRDVTVIVDAADYDAVVDALRNQGSTTRTMRELLAAKVFRYTAAYDAHIADYLGRQWGIEIPERLTMTWERKHLLRYGENPHQRAAAYASPMHRTGSIVDAEQLQGKPLSYNNIQDAHAAWSIVRALSGYAAVVAVKHKNPCGVGIGDDIAVAFARAVQADPVSIFGGIIACNGTVDAYTATAMCAQFLEVIIAVDFDDDALAVLAHKKNVRVLRMALDAPSDAWQLRHVAGGVLIQTMDDGADDAQAWTVPTDCQPDAQTMNTLTFAWNVCKFVTSNAIVVADATHTLGIGAGQMNRVGAARIALEQAGARAQGAVLASDGFLPMDDTVRLAAEYGIGAIIQPGGSVRDADSIAAANEAGIAMVLTHRRHFTH
jgi:phosphoribosylaminoimidazolecarboxamide formyltransferase/IMP cyclohydrolase